MATSNSAAELVGKLNKAADNVQKGTQKALETSGKIVEGTINAGVASTIGGDLKMGTKLVRAASRADSKRAEIYARGPMHWLEKGVKPHAVVTKGIGGSRAARTSFVASAFGSGGLSFGGTLKRRGKNKDGKLALKFESGDVRPYARRAGKYPAQKTWSKGTDRARPLVAANWKRIHVQELAKSFA